MKDPRRMHLQSANLEVTQQCDSRCLSCNIWKLTKNPLSNRELSHTEQELSFEEQIHILDGLKALGCQAVQLHGGEPLLNKRLPELAAHCSSLGLFTGIATNGLSMKPHKAIALVESGLGSIKFSLDGPKELHNYLRGRKDAFEKQINAIKLVQNADPLQKIYKSIRTNVSSVNLERIDEVLDIAKDLGIKDVQFAFYSVINESVVDEANEIFNEHVASLRSLIPSSLLPTDIPLIERQQNRLKEKADTYGISLGKTRFFSLPAAEVPKGIKRERTECSLFNHSCTIDAFGEVIPCEYIRFPWGSTRTQSLIEILKGARAATFKECYSQNYQRLSICDYCCYNL